MYTKTVEYFDIENNSTGYLPNLITKRINSGYNIINNEYLISFFGEGNNTIEILDLNNDNKNEDYQWRFLDYKSNITIQELKNFINYDIDDNIIILSGGNNNDKIMIFCFKKKYLDITDIIINNNNEFIFEKEKFFSNYIYENYNNEKRKDIIGMDSNGNIHFFNCNYEYNIYIFD